MTIKYFATLTSQGAAMLANAAALGTKLNLTQMAVGDANGILPVPDPSQTKLVNQKRIAPINNLSIDPNNSSQIIAEQIIPENEGGFWIREIGVFDDDGVLIAIANCPETYKPQLQEGSGRTQIIRMILIVSNAPAITLKIDPAVVLATRQFVDSKVIEVKAYADNLLSKHLANDDPHPVYMFKKDALDLFGATDSPYTPSSQALKIVAGGGTLYPGKMFVLSKGGGGNGVMFRLSNGNVTAPSFPANSENGSWALWRTGLVQAIEYAWVYKKPVSVAGEWAEVDVAYSAIDIFSDPQLGAYFPLRAQRSSAGGSGGYATFNVMVGHDGRVNIGFMGTVTGPLAQKIIVDGETVSTLNLRTDVPALLSVEIKVAPGKRVITIPHEEASTNLNIIGVNFLTLAQLQHWHTDVDSWACYNKSPAYVTNEGASDYAFRAKNGAGNWAGSYHGGEYERAAPEFSLDHRLISPADSFVGIGRRLSILQRTQLRWSSTGESVDIDSLTLCMDAEVFMQCAVSNADLIAHTAYLGMNTASPAFDSALGSRFHDNAVTDGVNYSFGPCQQVTQIERGTGRLVYTRFSRPPLLDNSFNGPTVSFAAGAYAKLYSGFVRNSSIRLPTEFSFAFCKAFM